MALTTTFTTFDEAMTDPGVVDDQPARDEVLAAFRKEVKPITGIHDEVDIFWWWLGGVVTERWFVEAVPGLRLDSGAEDFARQRKRALLRGIHPDQEAPSEGLPTPLGVGWRN